MTLDEHREVRAGALLMYARWLTDWRRADEPTARPAQTHAAEPKPHRGTDAARRDMYQRHAAKRRAEMLERRAKQRRTQGKED